ncbi:MAG TPA: multicopper oxidase domain-containing protein [Coleofasciculaceae cyanobacterium]
MELTRRDALKLGLMGVGSLFSPFGDVQPGLAATGQCMSHAHSDPPVLQPLQFSPQIDQFQRPFQRLQLLPAQAVGANLDGYTISLRKTNVNILPDKQTEVWSFNDLLPGPLIRQRKGRPSVVRLINLLQDETGQSIDSSIHLHGMASLPQYDGYAEDLIPYNHYKDYYYPNDKATTLWYHDHAIGHTSRNVYMGLAGMYIVDYEADDFYNPQDRDLLPQGDYEIPMIIQDKRFNPEGRLIFNDNAQRGTYGDVMLVNGVPWPRLEVSNRKYRFRILNGGTSRVLRLGVQVQHDTKVEPLDLIVVASDAGLLSEPIYTKTLQLGVAERYEVIIDFSKYAGKEVFLVNPILPSNGDGDLRTTRILCFQVGSGTQDNPPLPQRLGVLTPIDTLRAEVKGPTRTFRFDRNGNRWVINGNVWDVNRIDARVDPCATEIWRFVNGGGGWVHPVHVHLGHFRLLSRNRALLQPYEQGMKDTFYVGEFETVEMIGRFGPHEGKYMMHCHNLVHEDHDMMTQFEVGHQGCDPCSAPAKPLPAPPTYDAPPCIPPQECSLSPGG